MLHHFRLPALMIVCMLAIASLAACGSSGGVEEVPGTTTPFAGPLSAMTEPVTFNASRASVQTCRNDPFITCSNFSSLVSGDAGDQVRIDPVTKTVTIAPAFRKAEVTFSGVDFTAGSTRFATASESESFFTAETLKILLPGPGASGLDWASYGVWTSHSISPLLGGEHFFGEALSFGVVTPFNDVPTTGSASYSGFMDGFYVNASMEAFSLTGSAAMTANFANGQVSGQFNNISTGAISVGASAPATAFGDVGFAASISGNNFSGNASSAGFGQPLSGPLQGSFYGPGALEAGGVFRITGGSEHAVGAFAVRQ